MIQGKNLAGDIERWSNQLEENMQKFEEPMTIIQDAINE